MSETTKIIGNAGRTELEHVQHELGVECRYVVPPYESLEVPVSDEDVAQQKMDAAMVEARVELPAVADGVIGWPCLQLAGVTCTHEACMPAAATTTALRSQPLA